MWKRKVEKLLGFLLKSFWQHVEINSLNITTSRKKIKNSFIMWLLLVLLVAHFLPQKMSFASLAPPLFLGLQDVCLAPKRRRKKNTHLSVASEVQHPDSAAANQEFEVRLPQKTQKFCRLHFSWKQFQMHHMIWSQSDLQVNTWIKNKINMLIFISL